MNQHSKEEPNAHKEERPGEKVAKHGTAGFFEGFTGVLVYLLVTSLFRENGMGFGTILLTALAGGIVITLAELASLIHTNRWVAGNFFGLTAGIGAGLVDYLLLSTEALAPTLLPWTVAGLIGGAY